MEPSSRQKIGRYRPYAEYRDSGAEWLGEFPAHWVMKPNGRLFRERDERGFPDLPILNVSIHSGVKIREFSDNRIEQKAQDHAVYKRAQKGDIAFNKMRMWQGSVGAVPADGLVSPDYTVAIPQAKTDSRYYELLFRTPSYKTEVNRNSHGIVPDRNRLYWDDFKKIKSPRPPISEQRLIVNWLGVESGKIDTLIEKKERLIELLQENHTALITRTVTKGLDPSAPMKDSRVEWLGEIPTHWKPKRLWHLTPIGRRIMYGIVLPGPNVDEGVPIVKGGDVATDRLKLSLLNRTTFEIEARYARSRLRGGDLVYAIRGSIGEVAMVPDELEGANLTQDAARISYTDDTDGRWLLYVLRADSVFAQLEAGALGATIKGINIRDLKRAVIPVPKKAEQLAIAAFLVSETRRMSGLIRKVRRGIDYLKEYRTALISAAVTGKIDVREEVA